MLCLIGRGYSMCAWCYHVLLLFIRPFESRLSAQVRQPGGGGEPKGHGEDLGFLCHGTLVLSSWHLPAMVEAAGRGCLWSRMAHRLWVGYVDVSILIHAVVCKDLLAASYLTMGIGENIPGKKEYEFKGWNPMEHCAAGVEKLSLMLTCLHVPRTSQLHLGAGGTPRPVLHTQQDRPHTPFLLCLCKAPSKTPVSWAWQSKTYHTYPEREALLRILEKLSASNCVWTWN